MRSDSFSDALGQLDPASRALLDLSLRRGMRPEEIAEMLGAEPETVARNRDDALRRVAADVGMERYDQLDEVRAQLAELPAEEWLGAAGRRDGDAEPKREAKPVAAEPEPVAAEPEPEPESEPERQPEPEPEPAAAPDPKRPLVRPAVLWALAAALLIAGIAALASLGTDKKKASSTTETTKQFQPPSTTPAPKLTPKPKPKAKPKPKPKKPARPPVRLTAVGGAARGTAHLNAARRRLVLQLRGLPRPGSDSYTVWLYSSVIEAKPLATRRATKLDVNVKLPRDWRRYRYVDVSREPADGNPSHSGQSVARLATRALR